jgi:hypothetical protein
MKKLSIQLPILAICMGLSFPDYGRTNALNGGDSSGFILAKKLRGLNFTKDGMRLLLIISYEK